MQAYILKCSASGGWDILMNFKVPSTVLCGNIMPCHETVDERAWAPGHAGTEMAAGLHWFLKYACRSSVSWSATGGNSIDSSCFTPAFLQGLEQQGGMHRERSVPWQYYQNIVTPRSSTPYPP